MNWLSDYWMSYNNNLNLNSNSGYFFAWAWFEKYEKSKFELFNSEIIFYSSTNNAISYLKKFNNSLLTHARGISGARSIYEKFIIKKYGKVELNFIPFQLYWNVAQISNNENIIKYKNSCVENFKKIHGEYPLCCKTNRHVDSDI